MPIPYGPQVKVSIPYPGGGRVCGGWYGYNGPPGGFGNGVELPEINDPFGRRLHVAGWLARLDSTDVTMWASTVYSSALASAVDPENQVRGLALLPTGDVVACGSFAGSALFDTVLLAHPQLTNSLGGLQPGPIDGFVALYRGTDGVCQGARVLGSNDNDWAYACAADDLGNIFVGGTARGGQPFMSFMGGLITIPALPPVQLGGPPVNTGAYDAFVVCLNSFLGFQWQVFGSSLKADTVTSLSVAGSVLTVKGACYLPFTLGGPGGITIPGTGPSTFTATIHAGTGQVLTATVP